MSSSYPDGGRKTSRVARRARSAVGGAGTRRGDFRRRTAGLLLTPPRAGRRTDKHGSTPGPAADRGRHIPARGPEGAAVPRRSESENPTSSPGSPLPLPVRPLLSLSPSSQRGIPGMRRTPPAVRSTVPRAGSTHPRVTPGRRRHTAQGRASTPLLTALRLGDRPRPPAAELLAAQQRFPARSDCAPRWRPQSAGSRRRAPAPGERAESP